LWPGGLTLVLPLRPGAPIPAAMTGGSTTLGVRIPDHPAPREIARALGPLPTTSANLSGQPEALTAAAVLEALGERIDLVVDGGPARGGVPSTVVDVSGTTARLLREGAIGRGEIAAILEAAGIPVDPGG
jgi:L-threonylcarbamoyladenylate synthase